VNEPFPRGLKLYLLFVLIFFIVGYFSLVFLEKMSLVDAFYFLVVTVTTVGFGDITPTTPLSKIIVSVLILTSISSLALVSEQLVGRIVAMNTRQNYDLPEDGLDYIDHIIICGFTKIAENIAQLFQARFFRIVILDPHGVAVKRARDYGLEAYLGKPEMKSVLNQANMTKALALYLFMDDENKNMLTAIGARSLSPELLIYASTDHELSIELGNLIGITRTYHYERIVAANISLTVQRILALSLPNQLLSANAEFIQIIVRKDYDYQAKFDRYHLVGLLDKTLTEFIPAGEIDDIEAKMEQDYFLILSLPREVAVNYKSDDIMNAPVINEFGNNVEEVIIGGFNDTAEHIVLEMDPAIRENYECKILVFNKEEADRARDAGFTVIYTQREELLEKIKHVSSHSILFVNLFERLTDSLLVNTVIRDSNLDIFIFQLAFNRIETDVLKKSGADRILIPDLLMSRGMFLIFLSTKKLINSMVWGNTHIFEHYVDSVSPLKGKNIQDLSRFGYTVLLYQTKAGKVIDHLPQKEIEEGSHILLFREHEIMRVSDQFIDSTHY